MPWRAQPVGRVVGRARRRAHRGDAAVGGGGGRRRSAPRRRRARRRAAVDEARAAGGGRPGLLRREVVARLVLLAAGAPQPAAAAVAVVVADVTRGEVARAAEGGDEVDGDVVLRLPRVVLGAVPRPPDEEFPRRRVLVEHLLHLVHVIVARHAVLKVAQAEDRRRRRADESPPRRCPRSRVVGVGRALLLRLLLLFRLLRAGSRRAAEFVEKGAPLVERARPRLHGRRAAEDEAAAAAWPRPSCRRRTLRADRRRRLRRGGRRARISSSVMRSSSGPSARFFCACFSHETRRAVISGVLSPAVTRPLRSASRDACTRLRLTRPRTSRYGRSRWRWRRKRERVRAPRSTVAAGE